MSANEIPMTMVELQKIKLDPGEVLSVKVISDDAESEQLDILKQNLQDIFPNNKIMLFAMPVGSDIQFQAIQGAVDALPQTCANCNCGKAQTIDDLINELEKPPGETL